MGHTVLGVFLRHLERSIDVQLNETGRATVAVLPPPGEDASRYFHAVTHGSGEPVELSADGDIPASAAALLVIGTFPFDGEVPYALSKALEQDLPVLGVGWGMHAVNTALGGAHPVKVPGATGEPQRMPVFISPGAKLSYTIAGSGWVTVPFDNTMGIRAADLGPKFLASCYREDGFTAAIELPGRNWVIGVQWNAHDIESLPAGFDSLLLALVERAEGTQ